MSSFKEKTIAVIGAGQLGTSYIRRLLDKGHEKIIATRRNEEKLKQLEKEYPQVMWTLNNKETAEKADVVLLTTKEDSFETISAEIKELLKDKILISLGPICSLKKLHELFGCECIRFNSPVDYSADSVFYACKGDHKELLTYLFGDTIVKLEESLLASAIAVTLMRGVTNSLFEPLNKLSVQEGLPEDVSRKIVGNMLVSAGYEIASGISANSRLEKASGGFNPKSFTLRLMNDLEPVKKVIEEKIREACEAFKKK